MTRHLTCASVLIVTLIASAAVAAAQPLVTSVSPSRGPVGGGTVVTITGSGFTGATAVRFDGLAGAGLVVLDDNTLRVTTPAHPIGIVHVDVVTPGAEGRLIEGFGYGNLPTAINDSFTTELGRILEVSAPGVLSNDEDNGGGTLTAELVRDVSRGTLTFNNDGSFVYTPNQGFIGTDFFTYRPSNAVGTGNLGRVDIIVARPAGPQPPTGLYALALNGNLLTLRWTPPAFGTEPTNYILEGGLNPGEVLGTLSTGSTHNVFTFTAPNGALFLRVRTQSGDATSAVSNEIRVFVNVPVAPAAPDNLLGLVNGSTLGLAWRNIFTNGGEPTSIVLDVTGSVTTSLPLGLTEMFTFAGVPPGTYTFAVRALNLAGSSAPSSPTVTLTFPGPCSGPPQVPANFTATKSANSVRLSWELPAAGPAPSGYLVQVSGAVNGTFPTTARQMSGNVGPGTYTFSVSATNVCGAGPASAPVTLSIP
jgi:hypothetical protein